MDSIPPQSLQKILPRYFNLPSAVFAMTFRVRLAVSFEKDYAPLEQWKKERIQRFVSQLKENPMEVGKPLGHRFFREKKFNGNRLYFLVYPSIAVVLLARISDKKEQPEVIEWIRNHFPELQSYAEQSKENSQ